MEGVQRMIEIRGWFKSGLLVAIKKFAKKAGSNEEDIFPTPEKHLFALAS